MPDQGQLPEIFDRKRRRALRERAGRRGSDAFLWAMIADELSERLFDVSRTFDDVLVIGPMAEFVHAILRNRKATVTLAALSDAEKPVADALVIEEDRLPFAPESFDLVISAGTLDSVNDLAGALVQVRRSLRPDGLFLGHMFGAGTLVRLKAAMLAAHDGAASPHIHPQIDIRSAADLLSRTGFALPVIDSEATTVRYTSRRRLVSDLREMGVGNALAGQRRSLGRSFTKRLDKAWSDGAEDDGKVDEQFIHIFMSGWTPSDNQPKPAKRGSGKVSLETVLSLTRHTE